MGRKTISQQYQGASSFNIAGRHVDTGLIEHIILDGDDENIPVISSGESNPKLVDAYIGAARIRKMSDFSVNKKQLSLYLPLVPDEGVPIIGETVQLVSVAGTDYYKRIPSVNINIGNARINAEEKLSEKSDSSGGGGGSYSETSQTGTATSNSSERESELGEYFSPENVHKLRLYEGDRIVQSRFGQSIRFSGYNNTDNLFSPTIIIRNRQNDASINDLEVNDVTEEDVNKDGSIILMGGDKFRIPFQPGTVDEKGNSNFETNPINHELPDYEGNDQILINSERIIISSKAAEMLFFSKGDYGFISDGVFKIDNGEAGAELDFGGNVNLTMDRNNSTFFVGTGDGQIRLNTDDSGNGGTGQKEPLIRGAKLVDLLEQLIDAINAQVYKTPCGPSARAPLNKAVFNKIKSQLKDAKSTKNFTE